MAAEPLTARTYPVWFVTDEAGNKPEVGSIFDSTYQRMLLCGFNVKWVIPEECLRIEQKEPKIFVMDPFSGLAFEHLVSVKCRIMGPLCLYECLCDGEQFPRRSHPIYSNAMQGVTVCCTNLGPSQRADIHQKVEFMGGAYSDDFTRDVTHLVGGEVGSKKYHVAANFGLPILLPEWVHYVWDYCQHHFIHGRALPYECFRLPIFQGLTICVSQLSIEERDFIKEKVEDEGGSFIADLNPNKATHLILLEPKGEKYKCAKEWLLFCVHDDWFYDSLEAGYCMDENLYPPKHEKTSEAPKPETVVCSSGLEENVQSDDTSSSVPQAPIKEIPSLEILDSFSLSSLQKCHDFLDGCNIYLCDFKDSHMKKLCKIINAGGGNRFCKYGDCITHIICGKKSNKLVDLVKSGSNRPHVVSFDWLLECYKEERLIDENPFYCMEKVPLSLDNEVIVPCETENVKVRGTKRKRVNSIELQKPEPLLDMDDIIKQYLPS